MFRIARNHPKKYHLCQKHDKSGICKCVLAAPSSGLVWKLWLSPIRIRGGWGQRCMMVTMSMMMMIMLILSACLLAAKSRVFEHFLSLFKTQTLETAFAIFSHSSLRTSTVLPAWLSNTTATHDDLRTNHGNWNTNWRQTLLMSSVWSLLQDDKRSQNAHDSAWLKEVPQLQPVRLLNHQCFQTEKTHALVHRSQSCLAVRFPEVRNRKGTEGGPVHIGEKPVVSKQRNFFCTPAGSLKIHMLIHSGGKSFACTRCSYSCTQADDLKKHLLAHSGEKPFVHTTFWLLTV